MDAQADPFYRSAKSRFHSVRHPSATATSGDSGINDLSGLLKTLIFEKIDKFRGRRKGIQDFLDFSNYTVEEIVKIGMEDGIEYISPVGEATQTHLR